MSRRNHKIRAETDEIETKKQYQTKMKLKAGFLKRNKIDKPLARLIKKKGERTHINRITSVKEEVTRDIKEIKKDHKRLLQATTCQ